MNYDRANVAVMCVILALLTTGFAGGSVVGAPVGTPSATGGSSTPLEDPVSLLSTEHNKSESDNRTAYQIDVATGEVIENLGDDKDAYYGRQGRLLQALSVIDDGTVTDSFRVPVGETTRTLDGCAVTYDGISYDAANGTATVSVSTGNCDEPVTLTLAAYQLPDGTVEFNRSVADQQELVAYETVSLNANMDATVTINVTDGETPLSDEQPEESNATNESTKTDTEPSTTETETTTETTTETETEITTETDTATATDTATPTETESTSTPTPDGGEETASSTETAAQTDTETEIRAETDTEAEPDTETQTTTETEATTPAETATETESSATGSTDDLAITDVTKDADGNEYDNLNDETVTITNTGNGEVDLSGVTLVYGAGDENRQRYTFAAGFTLDAGESVTVHTGSGSDTQTDVYLGNEAPVLNNAENELLRLIDETTS